MDFSSILSKFFAFLRSLLSGAGAIRPEAPANPGPASVPEVLPFAPAAPRVSSPLVPKPADHRHVTQRGEQLTRQQEGCELKAYWDPLGKVWTIGVGHTGPYPLDSAWTGPTGTVKPGDLLTDAQADLLLDFDLTTAELAVQRLVTVDLTDGEFDALVDFTFNVGVGGLTKSTLLRELDAGNYADIPHQMERWDEADGKISEALVRRRAAEAVLWAA